MILCGLQKTKLTVKETHLLPLITDFLEALSGVKYFGTTGIDINVFPIVFTSRNWFAMQGPVAIILISWLLNQGYKQIRLIRSLKKFIFRYQDLVEIYFVSAEKIINDGFSYSENV